MSRLPSDERAHAWAEHLCHPLPLAAVLLLAVNDHLLKGAGLLPSLITGKLSDFAGLFFFPILLAAVVRGLGGLPATRALASLSTGATAIAFTALKLSPGFNAAVSSVLGWNALDPTDLWALLSLYPSWLWMRRRPTAQAGILIAAPLQLNRTRPGGLGLAAVFAAGLASLATSTSWWPTRNYPNWSADGIAHRDLGCATAELWIPRSGKQGAGVSLELTARGAPCAITLESAELRLGGRTIIPLAIPKPLSLAAGASERLWLAFGFDGDAAWNDGPREATLQLNLSAGGVAQEWQLTLREALDGGIYRFDRFYRIGWRQSDGGPLGPPEEVPAGKSIPQEKR